MRNRLAADDSGVAFYTVELRLCPSVTLMTRMSASVVSNRRSMTLQVSHPSGDGQPIEGFRFLWAFYVKGYNPGKHCQPGLIGSRVAEFCTSTAKTGRIAFDRMHRYPYLYICGVGSGPKDQLRLKNFHLPLRFEEGGEVGATTYNGYCFRLTNAALVDVPQLPDDFDRKPREHARCKNFQFAVACFGYPPRSC